MNFEPFLGWTLLTFLIGGSLGFAYGYQCGRFWHPRWPRRPRS